VAHPCNQNPWFDCLLSIKLVIGGVVFAPNAADWGRIGLPSLAFEALWGNSGWWNQNGKHREPTTGSTWNICRISRPA